MSDGNDPTNQPGGDWADAPKPSLDDGQPQEGAATLPATQHPMADNNIDVAAFIDVVKLAFNRSKDGPILKAFIGLSLITLLGSLLGGTIQFIAHFLSGALATGLGFAFGIISILLIPVALAITAAQYSLYKPFSEKMFGTAGDLGDPISLIKSTRSRLVMVALSILLLGIAVAVGSFLCIIPGLVAAFFLSQAPYLVATQDEDLVASFTRSFERAKNHWHVLLMAAGMIFGAIILVLIPAGILTFISGILGPLGYLLSPLISWFAGTAIAIFGFVVSTAAFTTIDELEGERVIAR